MPRLSKQEKTELAVRTNIDYDAYIKTNGVWNWMKEYARGGGFRHPWPRYFELTTLWGDKRHPGHGVPHTLSEFRKLGLREKMFIPAIGFVVATYSAVLYMRWNTSYWSDSIDEKWGYRQAYKKEFRAQFDGVQKPKLNPIW
eukprot:TRINITY_DN6371_c0_g1_i1.p1 TRINITY_DN6371_c0_g1~~TRINITY_DN6371_c0_g1_i1.p1  ORF type:complete len:142 (+),score=11.26 TRINITY_DN6371_c0_g1_i1:56-481(+)